jgi:hypothetical protein
LKTFPPLSKLHGISSSLSSPSSSVKSLLGDVPLLLQDDRDTAGRLAALSIPLPSPSVIQVSFRWSSCLYNIPHCLGLVGGSLVALEVWLLATRLLEGMPLSLIRIGCFMVACMLVKIGAVLIAPLSLWARVTTGPSVSHMCVCSALPAALLGSTLSPSSNGLVRPLFLCSDEGFGVSSSLKLAALVARYGSSFSLYPSFCSGGPPEIPLGMAEEMRLGLLVARLQMRGHSLITSGLIDMHPASVLRPLIKLPSSKERLRSLHALLSPLCLSLGFSVAVRTSHPFSFKPRSECLLAPRVLGAGAAGPLAGSPLLVFPAPWSTLRS